MRRFLPPEVAKSTVENDQFWQYLCTTVMLEGQRVLRYLGNDTAPNDRLQDVMQFEKRIFRQILHSNL